MEASKIQEIMERLNRLPYQKILFNGPWGVGKTRYISNAIQNNENIYYISLFGKNDINTFYEELYYVLLSKNKIRMNKVLKYMRSISFSHGGLSISIPYMNDVLKTIQKELKDKSNVTIIIDDLERKSDRLEIKEVFGFIDSIAKNEGIKIVLVSSTENLSSDEKTAFDDYAEKSIDRIYEITSYSNEAPLDIMGYDIWSSIKTIYVDHKIMNLRTLEKTKFFIEEVIEQMPNDSVNKEFNIEDIYRICAAVIIFVVDQKKETILIPEFEQDDDIKRAMYDSYKSEERYPDYIWHYILQNNLENGMMQSFIPIILKWFETNEFIQGQLNNLFKQVNSHKVSKIPLFMSDSQLEYEAADFSNLINNLGEGISIEGIIARLNELAIVTERTNIKLAYSVDEVVEWIINNSDTVNPLENNGYELLSTNESDFIKKVITELKVKSISNHNNQLLMKMINNLKKRDFSDDDIYLIMDFKKMYDILGNRNEEKRRIINEMESNAWLLPLPYGEISRHHWTYCHRIIRIIEQISSNEGAYIKENAREYFNNKIDVSTEEIFKYRMNSLINQYLK